MRAGIQSLSSLGISSNGVAAFIFNFGCILGGVIFAVIGFMKMRLEKNLDCIAGLCVVLSAVFLALIGCINISVNEDYHIAVTVAFAVFAVFAGILTSVEDILNHRRYFVMPLLVGCLLIFCVWGNYSYCEVVSLIVGELWLVLQAVRHRGVYEGRPYSTFMTFDDAYGGSKSSTV